MKQGRFMGWLVAGLLTFGFTACSDDDVTGGEENEKAKAYISLAISVPNDNVDSRTADGYGSDDTYEAGNAAEYKVIDAMLYLYPTSTGTAQKIYIANNELTGSKAPAGTDKGYDSNLAYYYSSEKEVSAGTYRAYVLVNVGNRTTTDANLTEIGLQNLKLTDGITNNDGLTGVTLSDSRGIVMSGRDVKPATGSTNHPLYSQIVLSPETNTKDQPYLLTMTVERAWAKVSIAQDSGTSFDDVKDNTNPTSDQSIATVELDGCALFNLSNTYYAFRHVGTNSYAEPTSATASNAIFGQVNATNNYVIDPLTTTKVITSGAYATLTPGLYSPTYGANYTWNSAVPTSTTNNGTATTSSTFIDYCLENTTFVTNNQQYKGYVTGITFKAKITPATGRYYVYENSTVNTGTYTAGNDLFYYNNNFYGSAEALKNHVGGVISTLDIDGDTDDEKTTRASYNIYKYTGGICYYSTFIRHADNSDASTSGVMEFAIVRNNHYYLKVSGVTLPGDEDPDVPDDPEVIESGNAYIKMEMKVAPWIVRTNDITLGQ